MQRARHPQSLSPVRKKWLQIQGCVLPRFIWTFVPSTANREGIATAQLGHKSVERKRPDEGQGTAGRDSNKLGHGKKTTKSRLWRWSRVEFELMLCTQTTMLVTLARFLCPEQSRTLPLACSLSFCILTHFLLCHSILRQV